MRSCLFFAALTLAACGSSKADPPPAGSGGSAGAPASGGAAGSGGTSGGGGASTGGPTCLGQGGVVPTAGGGGKSGLLAVTLSPSNNGTITTSVGGLFASGGYGLISSSCAITTTSACEIRTCAGPSTLAAPKLESAGTITITGASFPLTLQPMHSSTDPQAMMLGVDYVYAFAAGTALFVGGETLTVAATGAALPAFTTTLKAPAPIDVSEPLDGAAIDPNGVSFIWPPGTDGDVFVTVELGSSCGGVARHVGCTFLAKDGKGFVPGDALVGMHGTVNAKVSTRGTAMITTGDYAITLDARNETGVSPASLVLP